MDKSTENFNKELKIDVGIIIPRSLINSKGIKSWTNKVIFAILNNFRKNKFYKNKNDKRNTETLYISYKNLLSIIPFTKPTINKALKLFEDLDLIKINNVEDNNQRYLKIDLKEKYFCSKKDGFIFIPSNILYCKNLNITDKIVLSYIKGYCKDDNIFNLSNNQITKFLNITQSNLTKSLRRLNKLTLLNTNQENARTIEFIDNVENVNNMTIEEIREVRNINNKNIENIESVKNINNKNIENVNAENIYNENANINNNINTLFDINLLNMLDKASLIKYKKMLNDQLIQIINNK